MLFDPVAHTLEANQPYVEIKITYRVVLIQYIERIASEHLGK